MPKTLVVLSGGQDSTTCLFWAIERYGAENIYGLTFDYGQRHKIELEAARRVAQLGVIRYHEIVTLGPAILGGKSPLTDHSQSLELYKDHASMEAIIGDRVELTFVPMRNALFLTLAANRAEVWGCSKIITGVSQEDNANYPDCREVFIDAMENAITEALGSHRIDIKTPLIGMSKAQSIDIAWMTPGAYGALAYSHTAYDGTFPPTSHDHANTLRKHGFLQADIPDPLVLRAVALRQMAMPEEQNYRPVLVKSAIQHIRKEPWFNTGVITHDWVDRIIL